MHMSHGPILNILAVIFVFCLMVISARQGNTKSWLYFIIMQLLILVNAFFIVLFFMQCGEKP